MDSRPSRRQYLSVLSSATALLLAGCAGGDDDGTDAPTDTSDDAGGGGGGTETPTATPSPTAQPTTDTDSSTPTAASGDGSDDESGDGSDDAESGDGESGDGESGDGDGNGESADPASVVAEFVRAADEDDAEAALDRLHPRHPFHPDNTEQGEFSTSDVGTVTDVETTVAIEDVSADDVFDIGEAEAFFDRSDVETLLDDEDATVVDTVVERAERSTMRLRYLVVTHESEWRVLWADEAKSEGSSGGGLEVRVVDRVEFDTDADEVRVHIADSPTADRVTVTTPSAEREVSTSDLDGVRFLDVPVDPDGDEVQVRATLDGQQRLVHRERYPQSHRVVDRVRVSEEDSSEALGVVARVEFADVDSDGELTARSTVEGGETSVEPASNVRYLSVTVDDDRDEVVVTLTEDGQTTEVHRERISPDIEFE